ncbi:hypothetical protein N656DRAFT_708570 [Canariomyces notabilis]|uniref:Uncharacterized protein n=1 Tax=Canariomyces notabilis TaxID=2074819 RepID=A0AAN6TEK1_9PEZI|nr:hypothetical protein N656DRAFT_708570 [Canariomyces arenarius]
MASTLPPSSVLSWERDINITSVVGSGVGCPKGTSTLSTSSSYDGTSLTLGFDDFQVFYGPGYPLQARSKTCIIVITVRYRSGRTVELLGTTYHASALLDPGMTGNILSSYTFSSSAVGNASSASSTEAKATGPLIGDYLQYKAIIPKSSTTVAPCGVDEVRLQINTRISVTSGNATVSGRVDGGPLFSLGTQLIHLGWVPCNS